MNKNIYKRKDGRYEGRIPIYNSDGSRKYKYFFGKTKEEVIEKITKYRESLNTSEEKNITLEKLCAIARALDVDVEFLLSKTPITQSEQYIRLLVGTIRKLSSHDQIELCIDIINKLNSQEENEKWVHYLI